MVWLGIVLLVWFITFFAGAIPTGSALERLGLMKNETAKMAAMVLVVVGSFVVSLLFTLWLRHNFRRDEEPWPEPEPISPDDQSRDLWIAFRIQRIARNGAYAGGAIGLVLAIGSGFFGNPKARDLGALVKAPILMGGAGFFLGLAIACLFAPESFLAGPIGRPFLEKIGTRNVTVARLACLMVGLVIGGPLLGLTALVLGAAYFDR